MYLRGHTLCHFYLTSHFKLVAKTHQVVNHLLSSVQLLQIIYLSLTDLSLFVLEGKSSVVNTLDVTISFLNEQKLNRLFPRCLSFSCLWDLSFQAQLSSKLHGQN